MAGRRDERVTPMYDSLERGDSAGHMLIFSVDCQDYALGVDDVVEVVRMVAITPVLEAPRGCLGIINVRGTVTPVLDLRVYLGLESSPLTLSTPIVLADDGRQCVGLVVDTVNEVLAVQPGMFPRPDDVVNRASPAATVLRIDERLVSVLDLRRLTHALGDPTVGVKSPGN